MKKCQHCLETKELNSFYKQAAAPDGHQYVCKVCQAISDKKYKAKNPEKVKRNRRKVLLNSYGLSVEEYDSMFLAQNGVCKICEKPEVSHWRTDKLFVDHDHKTGKIRGLLCHHCNYGLGGFKDNPELLFRAVDYLKGK